MMAMKVRFPQCTLKCIFHGCLKLFFLNTIAPLMNYNIELQPCGNIELCTPHAVLWPDLREMQ